MREVEEALVKLESTRQRRAHTVTAEQGYTAAFTGTQALYRSGLASLVELEDARRTLLSAQSALVSLELERRSAWVALYRALGGGWTAGTTEPVPPPVHITHAPHILPATLEASADAPQAAPGASQTASASPAPAP